MADQLTKERATAVAAVRCASRVCREVGQAMGGPGKLEKEDRSPVTVADFASQAVVCSHLSEACGGDAVIGEEDAAALREDKNAAVRDEVVERVSKGLGQAIDQEQALGWIDMGGGSEEARHERYWALDPIDGTKGFLRGEQYAVALALVEGSEPVLGVLGCPNLMLEGERGVLMVAQRGQGTRIYPLWDESHAGWEPRVSSVTEPSGARFCESVESGHSSHGDAQKVAERLGITAESVRMDSQAKYATVARGEASIYLRLPTRAGYQEKVWDHAAGAIVVSEAGGRVTDLEGRALDFAQGRTLANNRGVIATNGAIHDAVVAVVREVMGVG